MQLFPGNPVFPFLNNNKKKNPVLTTYFRWGYRFTRSFFLSFLLSFCHAFSNHAVSQEHTHTQSCQQSYIYDIICISSFMQAFGAFSFLSLQALLLFSLCSLTKLLLSHPPPPRLHFWVIIPFFISISIFSPQPNAPGDWDAVKLCHDEWLSFHSPLTGWLPRRAANAFVATGGIRLGYHCCCLSRSRIKDPIHTFPSNKSERLLPSSPSH